MLIYATLPPSTNVVDVHRSQAMPPNRQLRTHTHSARGHSQATQGAVGGWQEERQGRPTAGWASKMMVRVNACVLALVLLFGE